MFSRKKPETRAYAVSVCTSCQKETRREFVPGNVLFGTSPCPSCGKDSRIERIFGEEAG